MKKKFLIILITQTALLIAMFVFSVIQKAEADMQRDLAIQQRLIAERERMMAARAAQEAERARRELQSLLDTMNRK